MGSVLARVLALSQRVAPHADVLGRITSLTPEQARALAAGEGDAGGLLRAAPSLDAVYGAMPALAVVVEGAVDLDPVERALEKTGTRYVRLRAGLLLLLTGLPSSELRYQLGVAAPTVLAELTRAIAAWSAPPPDLSWGGRTLRLSRRAHLMGIVNVTPDSFSDGGKFLDARAAVAHGLALVEEGADVLDVGGESTRPGAEPVGADEEIARVVPVVEGLAAQTEVPISIDTMKAAVARAALDAGASIVNDVSAGRHDPSLLSLVAEREVPVVLMHMRGEPRTMQQDPVYDDVVAEVYAHLAERAAAARAAGVASGRIVVDPGFGFGKTRAHNLEMLRRLREFTCLGHPVLAGTSRKTFIGATLDLPVEERREGTAATVALAVAAGASLLRVHEVGTMRRIVGMVEAVTDPRDLGAMGG